MDNNTILTAAVTTSGDFPLSTNLPGTFSLLYDVTGTRHHHRVEATTPFLSASLYMHISSGRLTPLSSCHCSDSSGNTAVTKTRTIVVSQTSSICPPDNPISNAIVSFDIGFPAVELIAFLDDVRRGFCSKV